MTTSVAFAQKSRMVTVEGEVDLDVLSVKVNEVEASVSEGTFTADIELFEGENIHITAEAIDRADNTGTHTITVTVDLTPPDTPTVDPVESPTKIDYQTITGTKSENTAKIIITSPQATIDLLSYPNSTTWSCTATLQEGNNGFTVVAEDEADNQSAAVEVTIVLDTTPPSTPQVEDDGEYTLSTTELHAGWLSEDYETGVVAYQYGISTIPDNPDVIDWTYAGVQTEVTHIGLNLISGQTYYFLVQAKNGVDLWSEIGTSDSITVNTSPVIVDIYPSEHSSFIEGDIIDISLTASDEDILEYQISIGGEIKQVWSISSTYQWQTQVGDHGYHTIKAEARDNKLGFDEKEVEIHVFRKPIYLPQ